ncbi:hypothetical protein ACEPPN_002227 [Leptodophora sp. 'Broadleaf-Isolate-01']
MSFDTLPRETLLQIGSLLPQSSLNALLQVRRSVAVLLTSQLYNRHFPFNFKDRPRMLCNLNASIRPPDFDMDVLVYLCARRRDSDIIPQYPNELPKDTLDHESLTGDTMLHQVAGEGNTRLFDMLVGKGVNINVKDY